MSDYQKRLAHNRVEFMKACCETARFWPVTFRGIDLAEFTKEEVEVMLAFTLLHQKNREKVGDIHVGA